MTNPKASPRDQLPWTGCLSQGCETANWNTLQHLGTSVGGTCSTDTQKVLDVTTVWMRG